eukprot:TRINITY_DN3371_c0_g1_i1.p1 TRINITY_DN3371_c0_g1~~TRINITY_DN3371_c0_g1_i1.p1  ORF type:complete len:334 (+),score=67.84 TRINITY_DN3371_c0_g1_i1:54-1055(+)
MAMCVSLSTLGGVQELLELPWDTSVLCAKKAAAEALGQPPELQRWIVDAAILGDEEALQAYANDQELLQVLCVFLPKQFGVEVKVIGFTPGAEATCDEKTAVLVTPSMTVEAVKDEIASQFGIMAPSRAMRLIHCGLRLDEARTLEQYHVDPEATLHLVVPRSAAAKARAELGSAGYADLAAPRSTFGKKDGTDVTRPGSGSSNDSQCDTTEDKCEEQPVCTAGSFRTPRRCQHLRRSSSVPAPASRAASASQDEASVNPAFRAAAPVAAAPPAGRPPVPPRRPPLPGRRPLRPSASLRSDAPAAQGRTRASSVRANTIDRWGGKIGEKREDL